MRILEVTSSWQWLRRVTVASIALLVLAGGWAAWHYYERVGQIPVSADPFDVSAFLAGAIPPEENAAYVYRDAIRAAMALVTSDGAEEALIHRTAPTNRLIFLDLTKPISDEDRFLQLTAAGYEIARDASSMPAAMFHDPAELASDYDSPELSELWELGNIIEKRAEILSRRGELAAAFEHHLTVIRMGRHCGQLSGQMQLTVSLIIETMGLHGLQKWTEYPEIDRDLAHGAFEQFKCLQPAPPSAQSAVKANYLWGKRLLSKDRNRDDIAELNRVVAERKSLWPRGLLGRPISPLSGPFEAWELERTRRLLPLLTANYLAAVDLEPWQRPDVIETSRPAPPGLLGIYRPDTGVRYTVRDFPGGVQLTDWLADTPLLATLVSNFGQLDDMNSIRRRAVLQVLALRAFQLKYSDYPDTLTDLKDRYFDELPVDPFSGKSFGYTRATGQEIGSYSPFMNDNPYQTRPGQRLLYSVGTDRIDQGGAQDWGYRLRRGADWLFPVPDTEPER